MMLVVGALSFTLLSIVIVTLLVTATISNSHTHHQHKKQSLLFAYGFPTSPHTKTLTRHPLKGERQQYERSQLFGRYSSVLWASVDGSSKVATPVKHKKKSKYKGKKKKSSYKKSSYKNSGGTYMNGKQPMHFTAARHFNSQLTKCNTVSELLTTFMEQTSSSDDESSSPPRSAATHLAGANKVNSVNFSTCLHRLARFASNNNNNNNNNNNKRRQQHNNNNNDADERTKVLSDPKFALLVCSMAEMASGIDANTSIQEGNSIVQQWKKEIEETDTNNSAAKEAASSKAMSVLSTSQSKNSFSSRECSNVCWALAKLRMAPPCTAFSVGRVVDNETPASTRPLRQFTSMDDMSLDVLDSSLHVRMKLFEEARNRKQQGTTGAGGGWIPELSRLAGKVLDLIGVQIINEYGLRDTNDDETSRRGASFNPQEMASVLWAFAKAKRGDDALFSVVASELMKQTELELEKKDGQGPKPQGIGFSVSYYTVHYLFLLFLTHIYPFLLRQN